MRARARHIALELLPPVVSRSIAHSLSRLRETSDPDDSTTVVSTTAQLDEWLERTDAAQAVSDDALREVLASFRYELNTDLPEDPFSPEYAAAQWDIYRHISGRPDYLASANELTEFDMEALTRRPFPYSSMSCHTVGDQLIMQGLVIQNADLPPESDVLEFGPGWGNLTLHLAQMGHNVTAVDVCPQFVELISRRSEQLGLDVELSCETMLTFETQKRYDAVVFFECFHHCADHRAMLDRLHSLVKDDGIVVFGMEPITPTSHPWGTYPWGIRLDGMSVWSIRKFGWLELGFTDDYFLSALERSGWNGQITHFPQGTIVVARKRSALGA